MSELEPYTQLCRDCGDSFTLTAGELDFYHDRNLVLPKRCADCRKARRAEREAEVRR